MISIPLVLIVAPSLNPDGSRAYSSRGPLFDADVASPANTDTRLIVERSTTPFCDAARALLAEGVNPAAKLVMRHAGSGEDALCSTVGKAAGLTVSESGDGRPRFSKWRPNAFHGPQSSSESSPTREEDLPGLQEPAAPEPIPEPVP